MPDRWLDDPSVLVDEVYPVLSRLIRISGFRFTSIPGIYRNRLTGTRTFEDGSRPKAHPDASCMLPVAH